MSFKAHYLKTPTLRPSDIGLNTYDNRYRELIEATLVPISDLLADPTAEITRGRVIGAILGYSLTLDIVPMLGADVVKLLDDEMFLNWIIQIAVEASHYHRPSLQRDYSFLRLSKNLTNVVMVIKEDAGLMEIVW